jgi:hypothetical protein
MSSPIEHVLFLQRTIGNQAVQRLIKSGTLQAKLRIGQPEDVYEQEADRVADAVMRMPEPQAASEGAIKSSRHALHVKRRNCGGSQLRKMKKNCKDNR